MPRIATGLMSVAFGFITLAARADSPVTSTDIADAYSDLPMVKAARAGVMTPAIADFLYGSSPIDQKAAVANALGWSIDGKSNARLYARTALGKGDQQLRPSELSGDDAFVIGYLLLLDDYFHPARAVPFLEEAARHRPKSETVALILTLARAQGAMERSFCQVWKLAEAVNAAPLERDLRPEARQIIFDYLGIYRDDCQPQPDDVIAP